MKNALNTEYEVVDGMTGLVVERFEVESVARLFAERKSLETNRHWQLWSAEGLIDSTPFELIEKRNAAIATGAPKGGGND